MCSSRWKPGEPHLVVSHGSFLPSASSHTFFGYSSCSLISDMLPFPDAPACLCFLWPHLCFALTVLLCPLFCDTAAVPRQCPPIFVYCAYCCFCSTPITPEVVLPEELKEVASVCRTEKDHPVAPLVWMPDCIIQKQTTLVSYSAESPLDWTLKHLGFVLHPWGGALKKEPAFYTVTFMPFSEPFLPLAVFARHSLFLSLYLKILLELSA